MAFILSCTLGSCLGSGIAAFCNNASSGVNTYALRSSGCANGQQRTISTVGQLAASEQKNQALPSEFLFLISRQLPSDPFGTETGAIRIINSRTGEIQKKIETGAAPDLAISPDGKHMYVAAFEKAGEEDYLTAYDISTWTVLWNTKIERTPPLDWGRIVYIQGDGPPALWVTPDGNRLLLFKYAGWELWIVAIDTSTGSILAESPRIPNCNSSDITFSPDAQWIYLACYASNDIHLISTASLNVERTITIYGDELSYENFAPVPDNSGTIAGITASPDGRWLYIVTKEPRIAVVNLQEQSIERWVGLDWQNYSTVISAVAALSADGNKLFVVLHTHEGGHTGLINVLDTKSWNNIDQIRLRNDEENITQLVSSRLQESPYLVLQSDNHETLSLRPAIGRDRSPFELKALEHEEFVRVLAHYSR